MIDRRLTLVVAFALGVLFTPLAVEAQQTGKVPRIGILSIAGPTSSSPPPPANWEAFVQGLRELGYIEGRNIAFEQRYANGKSELFTNLAADLVRLRVDVIFARGPSAIAAAKKATSTIPIVGVDLETDPVAAGFVASLARPGGNITGMFLDLAVLSGKHLELLKEVVGKFSHVAAIGDLAVNAAQVEAMKTAARSLGVQVQILDVRDQDFDRAFKAATGERAAALIVLGSPLTLAFRSQIADLAARHRLPAMYLYRGHVDAGGLMSYGPDLPEMFRRSGVYVGRILGGARPTELPVERPTKFELSINMRAAKALHLTIPPLVLMRADNVVE